ncbi:unnamed protein product [Hymenolepis diminuta]|uniref:Integrase catalytic domain-containing protein n=1 Tax=Hymenolepis diminuta TaxID=6216 RepID=A0A0R3SEY7_HYMDI|nr:unnamed protein product [Hymenolepis diminuta]
MIYKKWSCPGRSPSSLVQFEDFCRDLNISLLRPPPNLNFPDEQLVENVKRKLLVSHGEENLNSTFLLNNASYWSPNYAAVSSKLKTDATKIYLDACYLPPSWDAETPETHSNHRPDCHSKLFRRHQKRFKVEPTSEFMDQKPLPGGVG